MTRPRLIPLLIGIAIGCAAVTAVIYVQAIAPMQDVLGRLFGR